MSDPIQLQTIRVHEFYRCKTSFNRFVELAMLLQKDKSITIKIDCFNTYSDFLTHLYEYYSSFFKDSDQYNRKGLYKNYPKQDSHKIYDIMFVEEVNKLCRNYKTAVEYSGNNINGHSAEYYDCKVPEGFGKHFRYIRNAKSHVTTRRISDDEISLFEFFKVYHKFILILYYQSGSTWNVDVNTYNWQGITEFADELDKGLTL